MNNACPTCGAIYNVAPKDVGRRIKCKKCGTPLTVTDAGLEVDQPAVPAAVPAARDARDADNDFDTGDEEEVVSPRARRGSKRYAGGGMDFGQTFRDLGGVPTLLFGFGAFLVIVFLFMPIIGRAAVERARGGVERLDVEWATKERKMRKDKKSDDDISKAKEEFYKGSDELRENEKYEEISNKRARWLEMYGLMFGFLFLMAGSIGYMTPGQPPVRRILGTVVLGAQMLIVFVMFAGGCDGGGRSAGPPLGGAVK